MLERQRELGLAYIFISDDLSSVHHMSHRMIVMKSGRIVEAGRPSPAYPSSRNDRAGLLRLSAGRPRCMAS
jgi:ABC-type glutathione transport system ATPase component